MRDTVFGIVTVAFSIAMPILLSPPALAAGVSGAIFTTTVDGSAVNANIYSSKCAVYLDGGPGAHAPATAAGLPDGDYYFQVTDPNGAQLLSTDPVSNRRFHVTGGLITAFTGTGGPAHPVGINKDHEAQGAITISLANSTCPSDFLNTPNAGAVYKVWATPVSSFSGNAQNVDNPCGSGCFHGFFPSQSKTDNFKVQAGTGPTFCMVIEKQFFNGTSVSPDLLGWQMNVTDPAGVTNTYMTDAISGQVLICQLSAGKYTVTESLTGVTPPGCSASGYQAFLNDILQPFNYPLTVTFTWDSTQSTTMTVRFVNSLGCAG